MSKGAHTVTFDVEDTQGARSQFAATVLVDAPPTCAVDIAPLGASCATGIQATILSLLDDDGDQVTLAYAWHLTRGGGPAQLYGTGPAVAGAALSRGDLWELVATPSDPHLTGPPCTASVVIENAPPSLTEAVLLPANPANADDITVTPSGWDDCDGDPEAYRYEWYQNGSLVVSQTSATFPASLTVPGDELIATVIPTDVVDDGSPVNSPPVTVGP